MLLLSIHPKHVKSILAGEKSVELRRQKPRIATGPGLIYASAPLMQLVASFRVASVVRQPLDVLWCSVEETACVSRSEFDTYFAGLQFGVAIRILDVCEFTEPVSLGELRTAWDGFHPPQGFRYLEPTKVAMLGISGLEMNAIDFYTPSH